MILRNYFFLLIILFAGILQAQNKKPEVKELLAKAEITCFASEDGSIWFGTNGQGLYQYIYKTGELKSYTTATKTIDNDFITCVAVAKDYVWTGSSDGLFIFDRKKKQWKKRKFSAGGEYGNWIRALCYDKTRDELWIGRFRNLTLLSVDKQKFDDFDLTQSGDLKTNSITFLKREEGTRFLWIGTESGLFKYEIERQPTLKTGLKYYSNKGNAFRGEGKYVSVTDMLFEKQKVWIATEEFITVDQPDFSTGGLFSFDRRASWIRYAKNTGLPANGISAVSLIGNYLWLGTFEFDKKRKARTGKGLVMMHRKNGTVIPVDPNMLSLSSLLITVLYFDGTYLWIGTEKGLYRVTFASSFPGIPKK